MALLREGKSMSEMGRGEVGSVVFYAEKQRLLLGRVAVKEGSRLVIEPMEGERFAAALGRLYYFGAKAVSSADELAAYLTQIEATAGLCALDKAWDVLQARGQEGPLTSLMLAQAAWEHPPEGDWELAQDAVVLAVFRDSSGFRVRERGLIRESAQARALILAKREELKAQALFVQHFLSAYAKRLVDGGAELSADESEVFAKGSHLLLDLVCFGRDMEHWGQAQALCEGLGIHPDLAFDVLVKAHVVDADENLAPHKARLSRHFESDIQAEANRQANYKPQPPRDLRHLNVLAIDEADTTEVDDAFALDGDTIWVFISDAASFVQPGSLVDKEAAQRASTVYLPEGKIPMVPPILGEGPMSLTVTEGEDYRSTLAFSFEIGVDGQLRNFDMARAKVQIRRRMTYSQADSLMAGQSSDVDWTPMLLEVERRMDKHRAWRHNRGAVTFQRPEVYYDAHPVEGQTMRKVELKIGDPLGRARQLIAELAVASCTGTAIFCAERHIPCVYRAQAAPDEQGVKKSDATRNEHAARAVNPSTGRIEDAALQHDLLRRMKPSVLQVQAAPHWSLGVPAYTQVTSPIRRYTDLLMHQQLASFLKTGRPAYSASKLEGAIAELGKRAVLTRRVESESRRYWALRYLQQNPGLALEGTVLRELGRGKVLVELTPLAIQEVISAKRRWQAGAKLKLEVIEVNPRQDALTLKEKG